MRNSENDRQDKLDWFDGKHINEILFCQEFLKTHPMRCIGGTLFTVDGPVESEELVKRQIIGIYGEDKIYDFIFRDQEYRVSLDSNKELCYNLDIGENNETVKFLNDFKKSFEDHLSVNIDLNNRKYLEMYFEYVFGRVLRGE